MGADALSWRDAERDDDPMRGFGRPGGDWQGLRPTLDNPMTWAVPAGRIFRISIRVHVAFLIYIAVELLRTLGGEAGDAGPLAFALMGGAMAALFVIVLLHELGHCQACRATGGDADEILMWPLGGLAYCRPENRWTAHLATVVGGPAVNVVIGVALAVILGVSTGRWWGLAIPNPFAFATDPAVDHWSILVPYLIARMNLILLLFNLLPVFPLDGGRLVQTLLWPRLGYARSMRIAVRVGYVGAIALGIAGLATGAWMLVGIALFGGYTCWLTHKQLEFTEEMMAFESEYAASLREEPPRERPPSRARQRRAARRRERERQERRAVDAILQKIADSGLESLTGSEKRRLRRATRRQRESS